MKKAIILLCLASGINFATSAQDLKQSDVPSVVLNAFQVKFPNATDIDWEMKGEQYKADFDIGNRDHDVWIDKSGSIKKHKQDIPKSEVPSAIKSAVERDFKDYTMDDTDKIEQDGKIFYQIELEGNSGDRLVLFSSTAEVIENKAD